MAELIAATHVGTGRFTTYRRKTEICVYDDSRED